MPIYEVGDIKNKEVVFGTGDIKISCGFSKGNGLVGVIALNQQLPQSIGKTTTHEPHEEADRGEAPVRLVFHKKESVDALIDGLESVKRYMTEGD